MVTKFDVSRFKFIPSKKAVTCRGLTALIWEAKGRTSIGFSGSLSLKKEQDQEFHEKSNQIPLIMEISKFSVRMDFHIVKNFLLIRAFFLFPAANYP